MNPKKGDILIGIVDFLSILIPGGIFSISFSARIFKGASSKLSGLLIEGTPSPAAQEWVIFILVSYIAGHFLHLAGEVFIKPIYEKTYGKRKREQHNPVSAQVRESLIAIFDNADFPLRRAHAFVNVTNAIAAGELERFEATAKLFRSLSLIFLILCLKAIWMLNWSVAVVWLLISAISFIRFADRRWKQEREIYDYFLILVKKSKQVSLLEKDMD